MGDVKDLANEEAKQKIKELVDDIKICMFCTRGQQLPFNTRPMGTSQIDAEGHIWFMSSKSSVKNAEIGAGSDVELLYSEPGKSHFLTVYGTANIVEDKQKLDELWTPLAKAWFSEGKDDPSISLIKVTPSEAYYWDTKYGKMVSLLKIATAAVTGKPMDGGVEGKLSM